MGLAGVVAVVFTSAARAPLLLDDYAYLAVVQRHGWWHSGTLWNPSGLSGDHLYRPILFVWFGVLNRLFGLHPLPFHIATGLLVVTAGAMTGLVGRRLGLRSGAYAAAAVFCLHASMATPIAWTSAASSPLGAALAMGALYVMLRPRVRPVDVGAACGLFLAALLTREVVAVTPAILVMTRYLVENGERWPVRLKRCVVASLPLWLVLVAYAIVRRLAGFVSTTGRYEQRLTGHGFRNLGQLMEYATEFGYARRDGTFVAVFWVALVGLCTLAALRSHRSQGLIGLAWALLGVLPVIFLALQPMQYYYIDFALPGIALAVGSVFQWIADAIPNRDRIAFAATCLAILATLGFYTARQEVHAYLGGATAVTNRLIAQVKRDDPHPAEGSTILLPISAAHAAYHDYADLIRVIYRDPTLNVAFSG